ncbi:hypothetical protein ACLOJK_024048 [Asimina triloba]
METALAPSTMGARGKAKSPKLKRKPKPGKGAKNPNLIPIAKNILKTKKDKKNKDATKNLPPKPADDSKPVALSTSEQLQFFLHRFQSANGIKLSSLELEGYKDTSIVELSQDLTQDASSLSKHLKATFGASWKEVLYDRKLLEGEVTEGSPAVLVISSAALRSLELLSSPYAPPFLPRLCHTSASPMVLLNLHELMPFPHTLIPLN